MTDQPLFTDLAKVTNQQLELPVEKLRERDILTLPDERTVEVERVDFYPADSWAHALYVVRWRRPDAEFGVLLGSLRGLPEGSLLEVERPPYNPDNSPWPADF